MKIQSSSLRILIPTVCLSLSGCGIGSEKTPQPSAAQAILLNQEGYLPIGDKHAFVTLAAQTFEVKDEKGKTVLTGTTGSPRYWPEAGDTLRILDFSALTDSGTFYLAVNDTVVSHPFQIASNVYRRVAQSSVKAFYYNRASMPIAAEFGGIWNRPAGHPDTLVRVHASAADRFRPEGTIIASPGGWYDAGDYNKYIVNSAISTYTLLLAVAHYPQWFEMLNVNIPESVNQLPDLLDEALYNLNWMLTLQDPNDGGVYHKLTTLQFDGFVMPHECVQQRYVVQKSTAAALDFAATMAFAHRVLKPYGDSLSDLSVRCMDAARKAYQWALKNPDAVYRQPADVSTGAYGDLQLDDEWFWAVSELYASEGAAWKTDLLARKPQSFAVPSWGSVATLGLISLASEAVVVGEWSPRETLVDLAGQLSHAAMQHPALIAPNGWEWGSSSEVANQGVVKLLAYRFTDQAEFLKSAMHDLNYVLGRNATGFCMVTGAGTQSAQHIHHRPSGADGIEPPVPGFLVGGPNVAVLTDCGDLVKRSTYPAKSYTDSECSYSTNEVAINWNAPLVFLVNGICSEVQ